MKSVIFLPAGILLAIFSVAAQEKTFVLRSDTSAKKESSRSRYDVPWPDRPGSAFTKHPAAIIRNNYYETLGVACKAEFKLEKATGIPLRFRLGSLQQTDYLEQKPNAIKPER